MKTMFSARYPACWLSSMLGSFGLLFGELTLCPAASVVLRPTADTCLQQAFPNNNMGASTTLLSGTKRQSPSTGRTRSLVRFDVAGNIPANAIITSAALTVVVTRTPSGAPNSTFELRRVLRSWIEGNKTDGTSTDNGLTASAGEPTWNFPWSNGGAIGTDYSSTISSTTFIGGNGAHVFLSSANLVADVQQMLTDAAGNFGWVFMSQSEGTATTIRRFGSREGGPSVAASLAVEFTMPPLVATIPAMADTALFENDPDHNLGGMTFVPIGVTAGAKKARGLYKFDVAGALPAEALITSATLQLNFVFGIAGNFNYNVHRLLVDWGEGNKTGGGGGLGFLGAPATANEATWNARLFSTAAWSTPGGQSGVDYASTASGTVTIGSLGSHSITSAAMKSDVEHWAANPGANFGWIVILQNELLAAGSARRFGAREDPVVANRPQLVVNYDLRPRIEGTQIVGNQFQFQFQSQAGKAYVVERRSLVHTGSWSVVTNFPLQLVAGTLVVRDALGAGSQFYRVGAQ